MRSLLKALTNDPSLDLPESCVITRVHFDSLGSAIPQCRVIESDHKTVTVGITDPSGFLMVDLRVLRRPFAVRQYTKGHESDCMLEFSEQDILHFVDDVHDTNSIHRRSPYVVPGLLILESMWHYCHEHKGAQEVSIHFYEPMLAGDKASLIMIDEAKQLECYADETLLFSVYMYMEHTGLEPVEPSCVS